MLSRRSLLKIATGVAVAAVPTAAFMRYEHSFVKRRVVSIVRRTVSDRLTDKDLRGFLTHFQPALLRISVRTALSAEFERIVCTRFIINSNLIDYGFNAENYEFIEDSQCNPFFFAAVASE